MYTRGVIVLFYDWCIESKNEYLLEEWNYEKIKVYLPTQSIPLQKLKSGGNVYSVDTSGKLQFVIDTKEVDVLNVQRKKFQFQGKRLAQGNL